LSQQPQRRAGCLPLDAYAALSDGRSVALVGADGSIDWWCVPQMDSPPLFDRLLDPVDGGRFSITPREGYRVERRYRDDSNVLEQVFSTARGVARITDSLNSGSAGRLPWSELARRVEGLSGEVEFTVQAIVGQRHGAATPWREDSPHGDVLHLDGIITALRGDAAFERTAKHDDGVEGRISTTPGSRCVVALLAAANEPLILPTLASIDARIDRSDQAWREWAAHLTIRGPYAAAVRRSALALKLLVYSPTGAIAAAATCSLPERLGGDKNYDYRYAWVRDVAYTIKAFLRVGAIEEARAAFSWLMATMRRHQSHLCTLYQLDGEYTAPERASELPGYAGSRPVRIGNRARDQLQLGVFGDVFETAALFVAQGHVLDLVTRRLLVDIANHCADLWCQPDSGMWELTEQQHYTMSKLGCWTALDRAAWLADRGQIDATYRTRWQRERDRIRDWVDRHCWSERKQAYTLHPGSERLDAALLLAVRFGFERKDRLAQTRDAIRLELCRGPHVFRYSGMEEEEGAFIACGFWLVEAFALLGDHAAAASQMDALLDACGGNLGLLNEQMDVRSGAMLGNMPQALSHLALIHAAASLDEPSAA
jgi:GH15 family glucan-1,4-alpha-glucosidase